MNNLITTATKALTLSLILLSLASGTSIAGGNDTVALKENNLHNSYTDSLLEMEKSMTKAEEEENIFQLTPVVKIYDANFKLVKESPLPTEFMSEDKELLMLMRKSDLFMKFDYISIYVMR